MIYPDLYALLHSDPEAVRQFKASPAHAQNSLEQQRPAAEMQGPYLYPRKLEQQEEKQTQ